MPKEDIMTHREFSTEAQNRHGKLLEPNSPDEERAYKNAAEVLTLIRDGTLKASDLKAKDRRPVVAYLRLEGYSKEEMSRLFEINVRSITDDLMVLRSYQNYKRLESFRSSRAFISNCKTSISKSQKRRKLCYFLEDRARTYRIFAKYGVCISCA
jgi:hypothetical protein